MDICSFCWTFSWVFHTNVWETPTVAYQNLMSLLSYCCKFIFEMYENQISVQRHLSKSKIWCLCSEIVDGSLFEDGSHHNDILHSLIIATNQMSQNGLNNSAKAWKKNCFMRILINYITVPVGLMYWLHMSEVWQRNALCIASVSIT